MYNAAERESNIRSEKAHVNWKRENKNSWLTLLLSEQKSVLTKR